MAGKKTKEGVKSATAKEQASEATTQIAARPKRDYQREKASAIENTVDRLVSLRDDRDTGVLGNEVFKYAQIMILSSLPYRPTKERQFVRSVRLSDGSVLRITFTASITGIEMPFGNDQDCLAWLLDGAIRNDDRFVPIKNAAQYFRDTGKKQNGDRTKELAARLRRISGLSIGIERRGSRSNETFVLPIIEKSNLPTNLRGHLDSEDSGQESFEGLENPYGMLINELIFKDAREYHAAMPRRMWLLLQSQKGGPLMRALVIYFTYRCYSALTETLIPWVGSNGQPGLMDQFPQDDSNPRRFKANVKKAIIQLRTIWPQVRLEVEEKGVRIYKPTEPLLPDDPTKRRVRRLDRPKDE